MKKIVKTITIFIFFLFTFLMLGRMLVGGGEDTWICVNGEWVKHGVPSAPRPEKECGK